MRVRFFATIRKITGCAEADLPHKETIGALARSLCDLYGEALRKKIFPDGISDSSLDASSIATQKCDNVPGELKFGPEIIFLINGRHVNHLGGTAAPLNPDDRVDVFPVVAGG